MARLRSSIAAKPVNDVWVIHPKLSVGSQIVDDSIDRVTIDEDLKLLVRAELLTILDACERWFGGAWPGKALGGLAHLGTGELLGNVITESGRSSAGIKGREFIIHSLLLTSAASAEALVFGSSPCKVG